jgi:hypothetical protein
VNATRSPRRAMGFGKVILLCVLLGLIGGGVGAVLSALGLAPEPPIHAAMVLVAGGLGLWLSRLWWLGVDEGVREAHQASWFWGGSTALIGVGAIAVALYSIAGGTGAQYGLTPAEAGMMLAGVTLTVVLLLVGYGVCWAGWWFTRGR